MHTFCRCLQRYHGERYVKRFRCLDQYFSMAFAQLTYRERLRDIEACLRARTSQQALSHGHPFQNEDLGFELDLPLEQILANSDYKSDKCDIYNQLNLFENLTGQ